MFIFATFVLFLSPYFLTLFLLPEVHHHHQRQAGANHQRGHNSQYDAYNGGGVVGLVVPHSADVINFPVHKHLQARINEKMGKKRGKGKLNKAYLFIYRKYISSCNR